MSRTVVRHPSPKPTTQPADWVAAATGEKPLVLLLGSMEETYSQRFTELANLYGITLMQATTLEEARPVLTPQSGKIQLRAIIVSDAFLQNPDFEEFRIILHLASGNGFTGNVVFDRHRRDTPTDYSEPVQEYGFVCILIPYGTRDDVVITRILHLAVA